MAVNKNFVVKNGLEVNTKLILADANRNKVGIGSTAPRFELDVAGGIGATNFYLSGIGTFANELNVGSNGSVLTVLGVGGSVGIGTALPAYLLDVRSATSTGTTALYVRGDVQITGDLTVDDITFDQANINYLNVTGLATIAQLAVPGLTTSLNLVVSGISTFNDYVDINDNVDISGTLNVAGIATIATISVIGAQLTNINVTGVTTLGSVKVSSGIITSTSGIVTYYGDGSQLDGVIGGIGINTEGGLVGFGITYLHLKGAGVSTTFYNANTGIATVFFQGGGGGGGGGSVSISSVAPTSPTNGDLWYSIDYGRTFVYYDETVLGIGSTAVWVDAAPFNVGLLTIDDLSVANLTVTNGIVVSGVITAIDFNSTSDESLKTNIHTVDNALDIVNDLRGVSFEWKENGKSSYGVIAQELEKVLPALVSDGAIKTVNYNGIIGVLIEAVKELSAEVEELKNSK